MVRPRSRVLSAALVASLLALTGCQSRIGTNYGAPALPVGVPAQAAPQTPAAPAVVPTGTATTVAGLARLAGAPMANAALKVENALTGTPMALLMPDGREVAGSDPELKTDAEGRFSLRVLSVSADQVLRVVATVDGKTLSALVSGDGINLSGYSLLDTTFLVNVDEVSRAIDLVASGPLTLIAKTLKTSAGAEVRKTLLQDLKATTAKLVEAARTNPSLVTLLNNFSNLKTPAEQAEAVKQALTAANLATEVNSLVATTMQATALKAQQATNLVEGYTTDAFTNVQLVGTSFQVNLGANNSLQIVNTTTGQAISVTGDSAAPSGGSGGGGSSGGGSSTPVFSPQVAIATYANGTLTVKLTQPSTDQEVQTMAARIAQADVVLEDGVASGLTAKLDNDADESVLELGAASRELDILQDDAATTTISLPTEFAADGATTLLWRGFLKTEAGTVVGTFQVVKDDTYYYLLTAYEQPDAFEIKAARSTTLKAVNVLTSAPANFSATLVMVSRNATRVSRTQTVTVTAP